MGYGRGNIIKNNKIRYGMYEKDVPGVEVRQTLLQKITLKKVYHLFLT
jgi:hypothetical protein